MKTCMKLMTSVVNGIKDATTTGAKNTPTTVTPASSGSASSTLIAYSQNDPTWKNIPIGHTKTKIGAMGCLITCLGMMTRKTPPEVNLILMKAGAYIEDIVVHTLAADALKLHFHGMIVQDKNKKLNAKPPQYVSILETDHYAPKVKQHFCVWLNDKGKIIDPWDGQIKQNPYHISGWRLYKVGLI